MSGSRFHPLAVSAIRATTEDAVALRFDIPAELKSTFAFEPGQYLTIETKVDGMDVRRSYSICAPNDGPYVEIGLKRVPGGVMSNHLAALDAGAVLNVMPPEGRFVADPQQIQNLLLIAAGSGITPCLSIAASVLAQNAEATITLVYGNKQTNSIMFRAELDALKDKYTHRFRLYHVLSREAQDVELMRGRIDAAKLNDFADSGLIDPTTFDAAYICGPMEMTEICVSTLAELGLDARNIHRELFATAGSGPSRVAPPVDLEAPSSGQVSIVLDGGESQFPIDPQSETVLAAARRAGLDMPYSCEGGMCCTCRCKLVEGEAEMDVNYSLQDWELEAGYVLACQTRPKSPNVKLDFDAV